MKKSFFFFTFIMIAVSFMSSKTYAQHYKLRQANTIMGMKSESVIYVKGMRKRTESSGMMGMGSNPTTIEQCDLQRTIKINDSKKLYYIEPFAKDEDEIIQEDEKAPLQKKAVTQQKGGTIYMWYNIYDTVDRKKLYGFNARHIWTYQKIKPSTDACSMKDSLIMRSDGWYIDLPQFNCPVSYRPGTASASRQNIPPDCKDHFVIRHRGKGKLGFPLSETKKLEMANGSSIEMGIETLEFSTAKLDSMLFEIPLGYTETTNEADLRDKMDAKEMLKQMKNKGNEMVQQQVNDQKKAGMIRVGVYVPTGDEQVAAADLQNHIVTTLTQDNIEAIAVSSEDDAKKNKCDYTLSPNFSKIKQVNKVGGLLKAIKNADPGAASTYNIEATLKLVHLSDAVTRLDQKVDGKFEGKIDDAAGKAMDQGCVEVIKKLKQ